MTLSSVSADSCSDSGDDSKYQYHSMPKIYMVVQQILEQIRLLYELSALLRRPNLRDKYIRSINPKIRHGHVERLGYLATKYRI